MTGGRKRALPIFTRRNSRRAGKNRPAKIFEKIFEQYRKNEKIQSFSKIF
jgi:hypothetical protein